MKRNLRESLVDYDMPLLRALAEVRGALLSTHHRLTAAAELAEQLAAPASLAITLAELQPQEIEALGKLQATGGWMEAPRFARRFGAIRVMGPGRLERERPWLSPANPAEALWYRALIFKGFRQTEAGVVEVVYVPDDLSALLGELLPETPSSLEAEEGFTLEPAPPPAHQRASGADLVEDVFGVLTVIRNQDVRLNHDGSLRLKDLQAINALCVSPLPPAQVAEDDRLAFVIHVCLAAGLVTVAQDALSLSLDAARAWLQAPPVQRLLPLQTAWFEDAHWNDLWRVPSLRPQPTGWKNDPLLARRRALGFLAGCRPGEWYRLRDLTAAAKSHDPDFQRPDGDYLSWYIHDLSGQPLMGFEHWEDVEGALLRYLVSGPLHWLGVNDLGFEAGAGVPTAFRLAASGLPFLKLAASSPHASPAGVLESQTGEEGLDETVHAASDRAADEVVQPQDAPAASSALAVQDDFTVRVPLDASLYTRFQLARFADLVTRERGVVVYRMSPASLARVRRQGVSFQQISAFLYRTSRGRVSRQVLEGLESWLERSGLVRLEQGLVLHVDRPETLETLRRHPGLGPLLGEVLGPQAVLVPRSNVGSVRRWLIKLGYLDAH